MKDFEMRYVGSHVEVYTGSLLFYRNFKIPAGMPAPGRISSLTTNRILP